MHACKPVSKVKYNTTKDAARNWNALSHPSGPVRINPILWDLGYSDSTRKQSSSSRRNCNQRRGKKTSSRLCDSLKLSNPSPLFSMDSLHNFAFAINERQMKHRERLMESPLITVGFFFPFPFPFTSKIRFTPPSFLLRFINLRNLT